MRADFRLEDWIVRPLRDTIERGDEIVHIHPKPMAVLEALAAAGGEVVTRDELFEKVWPGVIVTDDALTQCIVELRKAFADLASDARVIKTVPKVGFCLVPPVTFMDDAPQDNERKSLLPEGRGYRSLIIRTTLVIVAVILLMLAGSWLQEDADEPVSASPVSIAVLPFADLSEAGDQQWFSDGLSEELINMLGRVEGLNVTNRTSSFHFRDTDEEMQVIAKTLGVSHILEGSVRRDAGQLRVTAQLIDAGSGYHLWSEAYDRELKGVLELQQDISRAVTHALMVSLGFRFGAVPGVYAAVDSAAHDAVLMGRHLVAKRTLGDMRTAVGMFEKAIELEPDYALAHAELAMAIRLLANLGGGLNRNEALSLAMPHTEKALALDPELAEAWAAAAWVQETSEERIKHFEQAIRINPSYAIAYTWLARALKAKGRYQEAFVLLEKTIRLDPLSIPGITNYMTELAARSRLDEARREVEKLAFLSPDLHLRYGGWLASEGGNYSVHALGALEALSINPDRRKSMRIQESTLARMGMEQEALAVRELPGAMTLLVLGKPEQAVHVAQQRLARNPDNGFPKRNLGLALAAAGEYERAKPILEDRWQSVAGQVNRASSFRGHEAVALIDVRRAAGEETGELLAAMQDYVNRLKGAGITGTTLPVSVDYLEGITAYLSGQRETGLWLIAQAVEKGGFVLPNQAYLQALYDDPGFAPIMAKQKSRQARERDKFLAVVCKDNPYNEVWQPAEETCEQLQGGSESRVGRP